jgi:alginate O-acetyltransferase complex protein AlgI
MVFSIAVNYLFALKISGEHEKGNTGKTLVISATAVNLALIGVFKYAGFILSIFGLGDLGISKIPLPIGISFYTFQILSYVIDVYRKEVPAQRNIFFLGAYLSGFPQLIAGPIVRYQTISEELNDRTENFAEFASGGRRFIAGLAKKVLIANNTAALADGILRLAGKDYGAVGAWLAMIAYSLQIYFDFSGYSDMAIGLGRMMGFHYLENFNYPYIAQSVTDFWRRWHISLSTFFRDYVYIPLGGNRVSKLRWILNMMVVWLLTGLWHGAAWTFILWGLYFGAILLAEKLFILKILEKLPVIRNLYTIILFIFGWVIFRAESVSHIGEIAASMLGANGSGSFIWLTEQNIVQMPHLIAIIAGFICSMPVSKYLGKVLSANYAGKILIDVSTAAAFIYCIFSLALGSYNPFIYFIF